MRARLRRAPEFGEKIRKPIHLALGQGQGRSRLRKVSRPCAPRLACTTLGVGLGLGFGFGFGLGFGLELGFGLGLGLAEASARLHDGMQ